MTVKPMRSMICELNDMSSFYVFFRRNVCEIFSMFLKVEKPMVAIIMLRATVPFLINYNSLFNLESISVFTSI